MLRFFGKKAFGEYVKAKYSDVAWGSETILSRTQEAPEVSLRGSWMLCTPSLPWLRVEMFYKDFDFHEKSSFWVSRPPSPRMLYRLHYNLSDWNNLHLYFNIQFKKVVLPGRVKCGGTEGNSGGSWLPEEKKANMWPGRGISGGSWPPALYLPKCVH